MMNFFAQQLRSLLKDAGFEPASIKLVGRAAYFQMSAERCLKAEFESLGVHNEFEAVRVSILNKTSGVIDSQRLRFADYFSLNVRGQRPHIWIDRGEAEWYGSPSRAEWKALAAAVADYLSVFEGV